MDTGTLTGRITDLTDAPLTDDPPVLVAVADRLVVDGTTVRVPDPVRVPFEADGTVTTPLAATAGWLWKITVEMPGRHLPTWTTAIVADTVTQLADLVVLAAQDPAPAPVPVLDRQSAEDARVALALLTALTEPSVAPVPSTVPERGEDGTVKVGAPVDPDDAVNLGALPSLLDAGALADLLRSTYMRVVDGRRYKVLAGVIRNTGTGWRLIDDAVHRNANIAAVSNDTSWITIDYTALNATRVVTFMVVPDEEMVADGILAGASVQLDKATVRLSRQGRVADYVAYNGNAWTTQQGGVFTVEPMTGSGNLVLNHANLGSRVGDVSLTPRGAVLRPIVSNAANSDPATKTIIQFVNAAGSVVLAPTTDMKVYVARQGGGALDPNAVVSATGNFWIFGIFEVP